MEGDAACGIAGALLEPECKSRAIGLYVDCPHSPSKKRRTPAGKRGCRFGRGRESENIAANGGGRERRSDPFL